MDATDPIPDVSDDHWYDVGDKMTPAEMNALGARVAAALDAVNVARVIYEPGDSTRYDVLFAKPSPKTGGPDRPVFAAVVNTLGGDMPGGAYELPHCFLADGYVASHWSINIAGGRALANLFNAVNAHLGRGDD